MGEKMLYKIKAQEYYDHEWWECELEIEVNEKGKIVKVEKVEY